MSRVVTNSKIYKRWHLKNIKLRIDLIADFADMFLILIHLRTPTQVKKTRPYSRLRSNAIRIWGLNSRLLMKSGVIMILT